MKGASVCFVGRRERIIALPLLLVRVTASQNIDYYIILNQAQVNQYYHLEKIIAF